MDDLDELTKFPAIYDEAFWKFDGLLDEDDFDYARYDPMSKTYTTENPPITDTDFMADSEATIQTMQHFKGAKMPTKVFTTLNKNKTEIDAMMQWDTENEPR